MSRSRSSAQRPRFSASNVSNPTSRGTTPLGDTASGSEVVTSWISSCPFAVPLVMAPRIRHKARTSSRPAIAVGLDLVRWDRDLDSYDPDLRQRPGAFCRLFTLPCRSQLRRLEIRCPTHSGSSVDMAALQDDVSSESDSGRGRSQTRRRTTSRRLNGRCRPHVHPSPVKGSVAKRET